MKLVSNKDKVLGESNASSYINVKTNRKITDLNNIKYLYYKCQKQYICGSTEDIEFFLKNNDLKMEDLKLKIKPTPKEKSEKSEKSDIQEEPGPPSPLRGPLPELAKYNSRKVSENAESKKNPKYYFPEKNDVSDLTDEAFNKLKVFDLNGTEHKAKIFLKDSGEFEFVICLNTLNYLKDPSMIYTNVTSSIFVKMESFFREIKIANFKSKEGRLAIELLKNYIKKLNNIVYIKIFDEGIDVFTDKNYKNNLKDILYSIRIKEFNNGFLFSKKDLDYEKVDDDHVVDNELLYKYEIDKDC